jgi:hypothetical protein
MDDLPDCVVMHVEVILQFRNFGGELPVCR